MPGWWRWITSWRRPVILFAWFIGTVRKLWDSRRGNSLDLESGHNDSRLTAEVGYENLSKEQSILNPGNLIGVGVFAHVHHLGGGRVRKVPAPHPDNLDLAIKSIRREGEIYDHLGDHPRVIKCLARGDFFVDLEYAPYGHIESYLKSHYDTTDECRIRFAQEAIEAVAFIHSKGIIHSDLAARQFLLDSTLHINLSDFGFSSFSNGDVLGFENSSHHLPRDIDSDIPSTIQSDLFALGSTIYEIMTGKPPYEGKSDNAITQLYSNGLFPDVTGILCGDIIMGCWQGHFRSAMEVMENFSVVVCSATNI